MKRTLIGLSALGLIFSATPALAAKNEKPETVQDRRIALERDIEQLEILVKNWEDREQALFDREQEQHDHVQKRLDFMINQPNRCSIQ